MNRSSSFSKCDCDGFADAAGAARNNGGLAVQPKNTRFIAV
jgi:hypothetical protein